MIRAGLQIAALLAGSACMAQAASNVDAVGRAFADNCFSPYLTAQKARDAIAATGGRVDFYDLRPFSSAQPSPVTGAPATAGTDRRCEMAFDGTEPLLAIEWVRKGAAQEGLLNRPADVPEIFPKQDGAVMTTAAQLNPNRVAVVQVGVRAGPNGDETFMSVERLTPLDGS